MSINWKCECGNDADLHECIDGIHKYLCNECIERGVYDSSGENSIPLSREEEGKGNKKTPN